MKTILVIIWLLSGVIALWRCYFGVIKEWSVRFNKDYWKDPYFKTEIRAMSIFLIFCPIFIIFGPIAFFYSKLMTNYQCWYYKHSENNDNN